MIRDKLHSVSHGSDVEAISAELRRRESVSHHELIIRKIEHKKLWRTFSHPIYDARIENPQSIAVICSYAKNRSYSVAVCSVRGVPAVVRVRFNQQV